MKLEARVENGEIIISKKSFKYLMSCIDKDRTINMLGGGIWEDMQKRIDNYYKECKKLVK